MTRVLHVVPMDASGLPPLINTTHVSAAGGVTSILVSSAPIRDPHVFAGARLIQPDEAGGGLVQERFLIERGRAAVSREHPDLVVGHNLRGLVAAAAITPLGTPLVYHCHDFNDGVSLRERMFTAAEWVACRRVAEIWVPAAERMAIARARGLDRPTVLVRNCPRILVDLPAKGRLRAWLAAAGAPSADRARIILRHGQIGPPHYIRETLEALADLPADVLFVLIGSGGDAGYVEACHATAARLGLASRFFIHPRVAHSDLWALIVDADVSMSVYKSDDVNTATPAPNKVFESLALGVPVVVAEGNSVWDDVRRAGAGLSVPLGSRAALAGALAALLEGGPTVERTRRAAREAHLRDLNYEAQLRLTRLGALLSPAATAA